MPLVIVDFPTRGIPEELNVPRKIGDAVRKYSRGIVGIDDAGLSVNQVMRFLKEPAHSPRSVPNRSTRGDSGAFRDKPKRQSHCQLKRSPIDDPVRGDKPNEIALLGRNARFVVRSNAASEFEESDSRGRSRSEDQTTHTSGLLFARYS